MTYYPHRSQIHPLPTACLLYALKEGLAQLADASGNDALIPFKDRGNGNENALELSFALGESTATRNDNWLLGYTHYPGAEPDAVLNIKGKNRTAGMIRALIAKLQEVLPGVSITPRYSGQALEQIAEDALLSGNVALNIGRDSLLHCMQQPASPFHAACKAMEARVEKYNTALARSEKDPHGANEATYFLAAVVNETGDGPFFKTVDFPKLIHHMHDHMPAPCHHKDGKAPAPVQSASFGELLKGDTLNDIVKHLLKRGITRLSFLGNGVDTLAFRAMPDSTGRQQLVLFTPGKWREPNSPFHLPARETKVYGGIRLRIMPELPSLDPDDDFKASLEMIKTLRRTGLKIQDVNEDNVRYYDYTDETGEHRVPMIIDWLSGVPLLTNERLKTLKDEPELAPWFTAQAHLATQSLDNTITEEQLQRYTQMRGAEGGPSHVARLAGEGYTAFEIADILANAADNGQDAGFTERVEAAKQQVDMTQAPRHQH